MKNKYITYFDTLHVYNLVCFQSSYGGSLFDYPTEVRIIKSFICKTECELTRDILNKESKRLVNGLQYACVKTKLEVSRV